MDQQILPSTWWSRILGWLGIRRKSVLPQLRALEQEISSTLLVPPEPKPEPPAPVAEEPAVVEEAPQVEPKPPQEDRVKRKYDSTYIHLRRDIAREAVQILDHFEGLTGWDHVDKFHDDRDRRIIEQLWGCDFLLWDPELFDRLQGGDKWSVLSPKGLEDELVQVVWPIDYAVVQYDDDDGHIMLLRVVSIDPKQVRGQVRQVYPKMVRVYYGLLYQDGHWTTHESIVGLAGKKWVLADDNMRYTSAGIKFRQWMHTSAARLFSVAFSARYEWHVAFGTIPNGPRVLIPTNPTGCLHLFNNRDIAPGKARRDILKHWVEEHWRDSADLAYVCHHLRGHTRFTWSGFDCELFPSEFDLEKNELFKAQAAEWRAHRKHNRVRVHLKKR